MTDSTLDLIDHAIRAHDLSNDAMRWRPDREAPAAPPLDKLLEAIGLALTRWQKAVLVGMQPMAVALGEFEVTVRSARGRRAERAVFDEARMLYPEVLERRERLSRMRQQYRRRRR